MAKGSRRHYDRSARRALAPRSRRPCRFCQRLNQRSTTSEERTVHRAPTFCFALSAALLVTLLAGSWIMAPQLVRADDPAAGAKVVPVETNMHEFMEYFFQPTFRRLKPAMAPSHASEPAWKTIKSDSLILAEDEKFVAPAHAPQRSRQVERNERGRSRRGQPTLQVGTSKRFRGQPQDLRANAHELQRLPQAIRRRPAHAGALGATADRKTRAGLSLPQRVTPLRCFRGRWLSRAGGPPATRARKRKPA